MVIVPRRLSLAASGDRPFEGGFSDRCQVIAFGIAIRLVRESAGDGQFTLTNIDGVRRRGGITSRIGRCDRKRTV